MNWLPTLLTGAGALLVAGAAWLLLSDAPAKNAARVAALPRTDPAGLRSTAPDTVVLLEGRLVAREPAGPEGFVAFHRERFLRVQSEGAGKGKEEWLRTGTVRPRLAIAGGGTTIELADQEYRLEQWPHVHRTDVVPRSHSLFESTERFLGFKAGDLVTVEGRVVASGGRPGTPPTVAATVLFGGDAAAYLAAARSGILTFKIVGAIFGAIGALLLFVGVTWLRRAGR
ncbi:MAG: hypothetical protein JNL92_24865 [Opitutaceae bacterium]|nr:hypothetical protein [Opitutaceae bacterium]